MFTLYYKDQETLPDSMCLDSNTVICKYTHKENTVYIIVRGYVTVYFNDEVYKHFSEMPSELQELFKTGEAYDDTRVVIQENNWYEIFLNDDEAYDVAEIDGMSVSKLEHYCKDYSKR